MYMVFRTDQFRKQELSGKEEWGALDRRGSLNSDIATLTQFRFWGYILLNSGDGLVRSEIQEMWHVWKRVVSLGAVIFFTVPG